MRPAVHRWLPSVSVTIAPALLIAGVAAGAVGPGAPARAVITAASTCPAPGGRAVPAAATSGSGIVVQGHGWGHGLGMSQYGAQGAARLGCSHTEILAAYYSGTRTARQAMTAPVELRLATSARRSTVSAENGPVTWSGAGRTLTQPAGTTWTVTTAAGATTLTSQAGTLQLRLGAGAALQAGHAGTVLRLRTFTSSSPSAPRTVDLRLRQGTLVVTGGTSTASVSEIISATATAGAVDRYLWGLGEVPVTWPQEALRAQVDAARTYLSHTYDTARRRYVIGVTTAAQVYRGADHEDTDSRYHGPWRAAVAATHDEVVVDAAGRPIWAMYSSSHGGRAESRAYVYGSQGGFGYLVGVDDSRWDLASDNPRRSWARSFDPADLARRLGFSSLTTVSIAAPGTSGRGAGLVVTGVRSGATTTVRFTGDRTRAMLGLLSPVISVSWAARPAPAPRPVVPTPSPGPTPTPSSTPSPSTSSPSGPAPAAPAAAPATGGGVSGGALSAVLTSTACADGVCGSATLRFSGRTALVAVSESVQDRSCNRRRAYVRLLVRHTDGTTQLTQLRQAAIRCRPPATVYSGLALQSTRPIAGVAVVVGESGGRQVVGRYLDNPNT